MSLYGFIYDVGITAAILGAYCLGRYDREGARLMRLDLRGVDMADDPSFLRGQQIPPVERIPYATALKDVQ